MALINNHILIDIPVFYRDLIVCFGDKDTLKSALAYYHDKETAERLCTVADSNDEGTTVYDEELGVFFMWLPRKPKTAQDFGFLSHEVFHATCAVLCNIGSSLTTQSEEVYAYLITYLTQKIIEGFNFISFSSSLNGQVLVSEPSQQVVSPDGLPSGRAKPLQQGSQ